MGKSLSAIDLLSRPSGGLSERVLVVFGDEAFFKRQTLRYIRERVLAGEDAELSLRTFNGPDAELSDVLAELATRAMFGGGQRLVIVENADPFITTHRSDLENYVCKPASHGTLVLEAGTFPSNTNLFKLVAERGLVVECRTPSGTPLKRWLQGWAKQAHACDLADSAAEMLVECIGPELGLLDQELAKLALLAGETRKVTAELVSANVGGSRLRQVWDMLDATLEGRSADALGQLDRLVAAGEQPVALLAAVASNLRKLAAATRIILTAELAGQRIMPRDALVQAGVKGFVLEKTERHLRRLGRHRGRQLYAWLLQADLALKGASALPPQTILERLVVRLASNQPTPQRG